MISLPTRHDSTKGFTLIEILVVIAIITLVGSLFLGNVFTSIARGRDSRRKQDLRGIAQALELYYNDNRKYPDDLPAGGDVFHHPTDTDVVYLQKTPVDPSTKVRYCYQAPDDGSWYKLTANLENDQDPDALPIPTDCGSETYNYGYSSTNITL